MPSHPLPPLDDELPRAPPADQPGSAPPPLSGPEPSGQADPPSITLPIGSSLDDIERAFIVATLKHFGGDKRRAASALGCSVKTLYNKLHLYRRKLGHVAAAS
jgi:DNA-binding NtrC family response regulator